MRFKHSILFAPLLFLISVTDVLGQNEQAKKEIQLKDLNVPMAPAVSLLDRAPISIDRPGTPKAFTASINNLIGDGSALPKNFAVEVAPYWLFDHALDLYQYFGIDQEQKRQTDIFTGLRNFTLSAAANYRDSSASQPFHSNIISAGIRSNLIQVLQAGVAKKIVDKIKRISSLQSDLLKDCDDLSFDNRPAFIKCLKEKNAAASSLRTAEKEFDALISMRPAFQVDAAYAKAWIYRNNTFSEQHRFRSGFWINAAFCKPLNNQVEHPEKMRSNLNVYGTVRWTDHDSTSDYKTFTNYKFLDLGLRIELEFERFSFSYENIVRRNKNNENDESKRSAGIILYKLDDNLFLTGSFGKNFGSKDNLIALFGINWGIGKQLVTAAAESKKQ